VIAVVTITSGRGEHARTTWKLTCWLFPFAGSDLQAELDSTCQRPIPVIVQVPCPTRGRLNVNVAESPGCNVAEAGCDVETRQADVAVLVPSMYGWIAGLGREP
jgi:hypothetical protein